MKIFWTLLVAAAAALGARTLAETMRGEQPAVAEPEGAASERAELLRTLQELRGEQERLAEELDRRTSTLAAPGGADDAGVDEGELAAAIERWRSAHPEEDPAEPASSTPRARAVSVDIDVADTPIHQLVELLADEGLTNLDRQQIFQELRDEDRIDEYLETIERLCAADPENDDLQVALGNAYLQKLFGVGNTPEAGEYAYKSDAAFDRALEIDDQNWNARFTKAVSLSNWPAFMGRGPEAIENFEILIDQQATQPSRPEFAMTYLFLGNLHQAAGSLDKAIAVWKQGLALFPSSEGLQRALDLAEKQR
jgi:tetratricopeptide (TPR) repeat protein